MNWAYRCAVDTFQLNGIIHCCKRYSIKMKRMHDCGDWQKMHHSLEIFYCRFRMRISCTGDSDPQSEARNCRSIWLKRYQIKIYHYFWKNYQKNPTLDRCIGMATRHVQFIRKEEALLSLVGSWMTGDYQMTYGCLMHRHSSPKTIGFCVQRIQAFVHHHSPGIPSHWPVNIYMCWAEVWVMESFHRGMFKQQLFLSTKCNQFCK